jgi:RNA recognition motif-containing protein
LYIELFPEHYTTENVANFINTEFSKYGKITSKGEFLDSKTKRCYAFVAYADPSEAKAAFEALNNYVFENATDKLYVNYAQSKD